MMVGGGPEQAPSAVLQTAWGALYSAVGEIGVQDYCMSVGAWRQSLETKQGGLKVAVERTPFRAHRTETGFRQQTGYLAVNDLGIQL